jgi:methyl-accepting chemotaxis protein
MSLISAPEQPALSTGSPSRSWDEIESEHASIIRLLRSARLVATQSQPSRRASVPILESIIQEFENHFDHEERIMAETKYPDARAHRAHHQVLLTRLYSILQEAKTGQSVEIEKLSLVLKTLYDDAIDADWSLREHLV